MRIKEATVQTLANVAIVSKINGSNDEGRLPPRILSEKTIKETAKFCSWIALGTSRWLVYLATLLVAPLVLTPLGNSLLNNTARG
jgi:hypothetical protein